MTPRVWTLALVAVAATGCSGETPTAPTALVDGTPARSPPVVLEGVEAPTVVTRVRVSKGGAWIRRCADSAAARGGGVERVGTSGISVTFLMAGGRELHACDASTLGASGPSWCGRAFGRLVSGRLRDPRLSLTCRDGKGDPLGFAWIQPGAGAAYVVVARRGYREVYPLAGDLPVRVTTDHVDPEHPSANLAVSEHGRDGRRLRSYELEARVSG